MSPPWFHPQRLMLERRHDGPIPPPDPAQPPDSRRRAMLFGQLAARQREAVASLAARHRADPRLMLWQFSLRHYRDLAVAWGFTSPGIPRPGDIPPRSCRA